MKTKLLKKIRKQYSIVYYPHTCTYEVLYPEKDTFRDIYKICYRELRTNPKSFNEAKDHLMTIVRSKYYRYTRKHKLSQIKQKVWYNT